MRFDRLFAAIHDAVATGKIGTPVAVRLHAHFSNPQTDLAAAFETVMAEIEPLFPAAQWLLMARRSASARQLTLLLKNDAGRSVFVTLTRGGSRTFSPSLLVIGNHGILRLAGGNDFSEALLNAASGTSWKSAIEASLAQTAAVVHGAPSAE